MISLTPILSLDETYNFDNNTLPYLNLGHEEAFALKNGTYAFRFTANNVDGAQGLFSKDASGLRDGGDLTVLLVNGQIKVRLQSADKEQYIKSDPDLIVAEQEYSIAVSFGADGMKLYLNGALIGAEPEFTQNLTQNTQDLIIGGNGWSSTSEKPDLVRDTFEGTISDFAIYDTQLDPADVIALAGDSGMAAAHEQNLLDLMPAFGQLHHASEYLKGIAAKFGFGHGDHGESHDGQMPIMLHNIVDGTDEAETIDGTDNADNINAQMGDDVINGGVGDDVLQGGYGNDDLNGGDGNDVLDGGHGEDILNGGAGDDFLIAQADGREGYVAYDPDRDEADPYNELDPATGKLYPDQPIPADDILTGGEGADTFYFQTLINAKQRFIEEHTNNDGSIRWHGVAGENDNIHDHWVDVIGNDVITDFSFAEGDLIVVEGHTTEILSVTHRDVNGDNILESIIQLYSNQGAGGGAHANDLLGTITVFGDLVMESDILADAGPAYGIVQNIDQLDEAITPLTNGTERQDNPYPDPVDTTNAGVVNGKEPVFSVVGSTNFNGERGSYLNLEHTSAMQSDNGTYALNFNANSVDGWNTLFSKDATGYEDGGHLTAWVVDGQIKVRIQSETMSKYVYSAQNAITAGEDYHFAVSFGENGVGIYLNGQIVALDPSFTGGLANNTEDLVIGGSATKRTDDKPDNIRDIFDGSITDVFIYNEQLDYLDVIDLANGDTDPALDPQPEPEPEPTPVNVIEGNDNRNRLNGTEDDDNISGFGGNDRLSGEGGNDELFGGDGNDALYGGANDDTLNGGIGRDRLYGEDGNDMLNGEDGNDALYGGIGDDTLNGNLGRDRLYGEDGNDLINGGSDNDRLWGGSGSDTLMGEDGNDALYGGDGLDVLLGGVGRDRLFGENGDDLLNGGLGRDNLYGGSGADTFVIDQTDTFDNIRDFNENEGDQIDISALLFNFDPLDSLISDFVQINQNGKHAKIKVDVDGSGENYITVAKVLNTNDLDNADIMMTSDNNII